MISKKQRQLVPSDESPLVNRDSVCALRSLAGEALAAQPTNEMDDGLAEKFISGVALNEVYLKGDVAMYLDLLPCTLCYAAIMSGEISRGQRIDLLTLSFGFVLFYQLMIHGELVSKDSPMPIQNLCATSPGPTALFSDEWSGKFLLTTWGIAEQLQSQLLANLAAYGSHEVEHLFGDGKMDTNFFDTFENFSKAMTKSVAVRILEDQLEVDLRRPDRKSNSGAKVTDNGDPPLITLGAAMATARVLFQECDPNLQLKRASTSERIADSFIHFHEWLMQVYPQIMPKQVGKYWRSTVSESWTSSRNRSQLGHFKEEVQFREATKQFVEAPQGLADMIEKMIDATLD
jgi:hypothetical protein